MPNTIETKTETKQVNEQVVTQVLGHEMTEAERLEFERLKIERWVDPETAEIEWWDAEVVDSFDRHREPSEGFWVSGNIFMWMIDLSEATEGFWVPGTIWVWAGDLPEDTYDRLCAKHRYKLALPQASLHQVAFETAIN